MQKENIIFKLLASYFWKQNSVFERIGRIIIDMAKTIILESNIDDKL